MHKYTLCIHCRNVIVSNCLVCVDGMYYICINGIKGRNKFVPIE